MDADGIDVQVVSPTPVFFGYDRPADQAVKLARIFNDLTLETLAGDDRFVPFCQVPLQDPDAACAELDRCRAAGHVGVEIGNHVGDKDLDDAGIVAFLNHCAETGTPVLVHPWDMPGGPRLDRWMARWLTGMPAETHLSLLAMMPGILGRAAACPASPGCGSRSSSPLGRHSPRAGVPDRRGFRRCFRRSCRATLPCFSAVPRTPAGSCHPASARCSAGNLHCARRADQVVEQFLVLLERLVTLVISPGLVDGLAGLQREIPISDSALKPAVLPPGRSFSNI